MNLYGLKVIESVHLPRFKLVQFRFPKTKRRRIQKKWTKKDSNFKQVKSPTMLRYGNTIIIHPEDLQILKSQLEHKQ